MEYIEGLVEALRSSPKEPELWVNVADVLLETGQFEKAVRAYDMALHLDPQLHRAHIGLTIAIDLCDEDMSTREPPPMRSTVWEVLKALEPVVQGLREGRRYRFVDVHALRVQKEANRRLARNPDDPDALFLRSAFLAKQGSFEEAVKTLDRIAAAGIEYPGAREFRGQLREMMQASAPRPAAARPMVRKARQKK